jgi:hypothetical protein
MLVVSGLPRAIIIELMTTVAEGVEMRKWLGGGASGRGVQILHWKSNTRKRVFRISEYWNAYVKNKRSYSHYDMWTKSDRSDY